MHHQHRHAPVYTGEMSCWPPGARPIAFGYYIPWYPTCSQHSAPSHCHEHPALSLPQELLTDGGSAANSSSTTPVSAELVVGGSDDVHPVLETLPVPGAANPPAVTLQFVDATGTTTTPTIAPIPAGYAVNENLPSVSPGTRLRLTATACFARLRWCEQIKY